MPDYVDQINLNSGEDLTVKFAAEIASCPDVLEAKYAVLEGTDE